MGTRKLVAGVAALTVACVRLLNLAWCPQVDILVSCADHGDFAPPRSADVPSSTPKRRARACENEDFSDDSSDDDTARRYASVHGRPHRWLASVVQHDFDPCIGLSSWDPWVPSTQELVDAMARLSASTVDTGVERPVTKTCLQRQQVTADLTYEQEHCDPLPDRMKNHASAWWRLQADYCSRLPKAFQLEYDDTHRSLDIRQTDAKLMMQWWRRHTQRKYIARDDERQKNQEAEDRRIRAVDTAGRATTR